MYIIFHHFKFLRQQNEAQRKRISILSVTLYSVYPIL